jgi:hypothetical protein
VRNLPATLALHYLRQSDPKVRPVSGVEDLLEALVKIKWRHRADDAGYCRECLNNWPCWTNRTATLEKP